MPTLRSACPLDCPDACSLEVTAEGGRVIRIDGSRANPVTGGYICEKVRRFGERVHGPGRILHPGLRAGRKGQGRFERVSWEEALERIAREIREARARSGGESILPFFYGGSNGYLSQGSADARLFRRLGASRLARTVCAAATGAAARGLYGRMPGVAYPDYAHANLIVLWGANPSASGIHILPYIQKARRRGAKLVVIDPRRTPLAARAGLHVAPRPGTDLPIALSLIRWLFESGRADLEFLAAHTTGAGALRRRAAEWSFERAAGEAGVPAADLQRLADLYAGSNPAVIRCGWGLERNRNGGSAVAAVLALPAVAGKFGARGGGYTMSNAGVYGLDEEAAIGEPAPPTRVINMNRLGRALLELRDPPVEILFVYNSNLLATNPDQTRVRRGLEREDLFTVVSEQVMTDTARYADVILPASTFLEHEEISRGYGAYVLQAAAPVVEPAGEARPNHDLFTDLLRRLELERPGDAVTTGALRERLFRNQDEALSRRLREEGIAFPRPGSAPVQFVDAFPPTAGGKIHLCPDELDREAPHGLYAFQPDPATPRYPLALISPATGRTISSTLGELHREQVPLEIHPEDAAARGIADGAEVRVHNERGEVRCLARHAAALRPGTVLLPKGIWSHNTLNGATGNALAPDTLTDIGAGACFNDARVQVEPA